MRARKAQWTKHRRRVDTTPKRLVEIVATMPGDEEKEAITEVIRLSANTTTQGGRTISLALLVMSLMIVIAAAVQMIRPDYILCVALYIAAIPQAVALYYVIWVYRERVKVSNRLLHERYKVFTGKLENDDKDAPLTDGFEYKAYKIRRRINIDGVYVKFLNNSTYKRATSGSRCYLISIGGVNNRIRRVILRSDVEETKKILDESRPKMLSEATNEIVERA